MALEIVDCPAVPSVPGIHRGEAAAIALANSIPDSLLLMDDRRGVRAARELGLQVTGTLGILDLAAERGFVDLTGAILALQRTTFRRPGNLLDALLKKHTRTKT